MSTSNSASRYVLAIDISHLFAITQVCPPKSSVDAMFGRIRRSYPGSGPILTDATVNSRCLGFVRAAVQVVAVLACGPAPAHEDAIGITADRMEVMKDMASHMSALQKMLDGRAAYDTAAVRDHARALHEKCLEAAGQFPDHAHDPHSRAAAAVWDHPERFRAQMDNLERAATELVSATAPGRQGSIRPQFANVGRACVSCHEVFRLPEH